MIDICSMFLVKWPRPDGSTERSFSCFRYFSCPLEKCIFIARHDLYFRSFCHID